MTSEDIRSELDRTPFRPIRLHLVSGKTSDITSPGMGYMLKNAVLVLHVPAPADDEGGYDVIALRNIERMEQLRNREHEFTGRG